VQSDARTVAAYIDEAPSERRAALRLLRRLCREELSDFKETLEYGMPSYVRDGVVEVGFASQKAYISLYVLRTEVFEANRDQFGGLSIGKGCIRFRRPEQIDPELVRTLLTDAVRNSGPIC
jgi:uncharacterized protein YdhG (YjbR/CyaY superfamily)